MHNEHEIDSKTIERHGCKAEFSTWNLPGDWRDFDYKLNKCKLRLNQFDVIEKEIPYIVNRAGFIRLPWQLKLYTPECILIFELVDTQEYLLRGIEALDGSRNVAFEKTNAEPTTTTQP